MQKVSNPFPAIGVLSPSGRLGRVSFMGFLLALCLASMTLSAEARVWVLLTQQPLSGNNEVELSLHLSGAASEAATLAVFIVFDFSALAPLSSSDGWFTPEAALVEAGVRVDSEFHPPDAEGNDNACLAVVAYHPAGKARLFPGVIGTIRLQIHSSALGRDSIEVLFAEPDAPVMLGGILRHASAANASGGELSLHTEGCVIPLNCARPEPPQNLSVSRNSDDAFLISWQPPDGEGPWEYRVYRGATAEPARALPLRGGWSPETSVIDPLTDIDHEATPRGCAGVSYLYYWVRARHTGTLCPSDFSEVARMRAPSR